MLNGGYKLPAFVYVIGSLWGGLACVGWAAYRPKLNSWGSSVVTLSFWQMALVGTGGFLGAIGRYKLSAFVAGRSPTIIPYGTLTVNLLGCLLLGWVMRHHGAR